MTQVTHLAHPSILLVEDNSNDAMLLQEAFKAANFTNPLRIIPTGDEAAKFLSGAEEYSDRKQYPLPILIFLDLTLYRGSGLELLRWLRQQPKINRIPVIVLTASEQPEDVKKAYSLGANSYMVKPTGQKALVRMVEASKRYWLTLNVYPPVSPFPLRF
ncbi:MAG: response regulator [Cyanobacteria bacterium P01_A01_bin.135]